MSGSDKARKKLEFDEVGKWSEIKLEIIRQYSEAYGKVLSSDRNPSFQRIYIDAFAGAGQHVSKATGDMIDGSPLIAVKTVPRFHRIHLIDLDGFRVEHLSNQFESDERVSVHKGDCNDVLRSVLPTVRYADYMRGLCLLDPYGLTLDWESIALAGSLQTIDMILNFPVADMNRNVFWNDPTNIRDSDIERMTRFWGDDSWRGIVWKSFDNLFADDEWFKKDANNETISKAFQMRLKEKGGFEFVPDPIPMKNSKGATVYYLYFASNNKVADRIAKSIFKKANQEQNDGR